MNEIQKKYWKIRLQELNTKEELAKKLVLANDKILVLEKRIDVGVDVLKELQECSEYWSEYDVPIGIHDRLKNAILGFEN